jgi:hypothetical protein
VSYKIRYIRFISWIGSVCLMLYTSGSAGIVADAIRAKLLEKDDYRRAIERNASSLGLRFRWYHSTVLLVWPVLHYSLVIL